MLVEMGDCTPLHAVETVAVNVTAPLPVFVTVVDAQEVQLKETIPDGLALHVTEASQGKLAIE